MVTRKHYLIITLAWLSSSLVAQVSEQLSSSLARPQRAGNMLKVPFNTVLPTVGDRAITSNKMLGAMGAYLRGYHHYLYQEGKDRGFVFKYAGNNELTPPVKEQDIVEQISKTPLFLGFANTELFFTLQPRLMRRELMLLFPIEGLEELRIPGCPNVIYFRPSHTKELEALIAYAIKKQNKMSFGLLYEESAWGEKLLATSRKIINNYPDTKIVAEASYSQGTVEIEKALDAIAPQAPNVVLCLAQSRPAYTFIRHALDKKMHDTLFMGLSELIGIQKILKTALGLDVVVTSVVPDPEQHHDVPLIKEYNNVMQEFFSFHADSPIYLETFINFRLAEACFKRILQRGHLLTQEAIIADLEAIKNVNFHGLTLDFNPYDRSLSSALWINPGVGQAWIPCDRGL